MKVINRNNKKLYKYEKHSFSSGVKTSIILFATAIVLFILSIFISFLYMGDGPMIIAGIGLAALFCDIGSLIFIVLEVYLYKNFHKEIRNMLILDISFLILWILIT